MTRSIEDIRRESERNRAQLAATVEALKGKISDTADDIRHKVSPENIKDEVSGYVAGKGRHWMDALKQQAMDNPMQTAGAAMAVAVPALRLVRAIPFPLLMIGAGLAISSKKVRSAVSENLPFDLDEANRQAADWADKAGDAAGDIAGTARERFNAARAGIQGTVDEARRGAASAYDSVRSAANSVRDAASTALDDATATASAATTNAGDQASNVGRSAGEKIGGLRAEAAEFSRDVSEHLKAGVDTASASASEVFSNSREALTQATMSAKQATESVVRDNAVLVGGLGLAIGAIIAAALPSSRVEKSAFEGASGQARRFASETVEAGFDGAKEAAFTAINDVTRKLDQSNVVPAVTEAADRLGEKLESVAEKAVTTAFEPDRNNQRS